MNKKVVARPFVKWVGGKKSIIDTLINRIPQEIETYYEPMVGGGFTLFYLASLKRFKRAVISDINVDLVDAYRVIKSAKDLEVLINTLRNNSQFVYEKQKYLEIRATDPATLDDINRVARLIYLNRTCFNGLYRVNKSGKFNVPFGKFVNPTICDEKNLRAVHEVLQNVEILTCDFKEAIKDAREGDTIYFDPPYIPLSKTSNFTNYTSSGFGLAKHSELAQVALELSKRNVRVVLSNSSASESIELYKEFDIDYVTGKRNIGGPSSYRNSVKEIIAFAGPINNGIRDVKTESVGG